MSHVTVKVEGYTVISPRHGQISLHALARLRERIGRDLDGQFMALLICGSKTASCSEMQSARRNIATPATVEIPGESV